MGVANQTSYKSSDFNNSAQSVIVKANGWEIIMEDGVAGRRSFWFSDAPKLVTAINSLTPLVVLPQNMF